MEFWRFQWVLSWGGEEWLEYWIPIGQWSLLVYDVSTCHSSDRRFDEKLEFVVIRSIAEEVPLAMWCLVGSPLLRRKRFSLSKNSSTTFPRLSVLKHSYAILRRLRSPKYFILFYFIFMKTFIMLHVVLRKLLLLLYILKHS